ncbi:MAG: permease [Treponema sp.]|nr:permease [Treponema sp.]
MKLVDLQKYIIYFWYYFSVQFQQIFIYWIIGMAAGSLISVFAKEKINRMFMSLHGKKLGILGMIPASLLGIASPLCMYGTIPIAASFAEKGMEEDWIASFMMSSILLNPQLIFYTAALGTKALVIRVTLCFLCGVAAGCLIRALFKDKKFFNFSGFFDSENRDSDPNILLRYLKNLARNIKATAGFFLIGIALSAVFHVFVPQDGFARLFGSGGFGVLMAATVGVPLYVCGGGTIPLLQTWLSSGMSMGSASAFMITGPAAKITNLGALKIVLGVKPFLFYLLFSILFAVLSGLIINLFFN